MSYKIEKNIPMPAACHGLQKYPLSEMGVGDSFQIEGGAEVVARVRYAAYYYGKHNNRKYTVRRTDPLTKSYRCWRIA